MVETLTVRGVRIFPGFLDLEAQRTLVDAVRDVVRAAPLFHPVTARGQQMSVRMTSAGRVGWVSDRKGYRYEPRHPSGVPWPAIPPAVLDIWHAVSDASVPPECCLINFYGDGARMGMHQDRDEADFAHPVVSISLGDEALFRIGNTTRGGRTESLWLRSGDVLVMGGAARLLYHGVDRVKPGSSTLLRDGGRLNLTLRVAT
ncbi:MAG: alpha-ketoglutarate-dependent dioxygenase AlkB [Pseudomonadota bacterium]